MIAFIAQSRVMRLFRVAKIDLVGTAVLFAIKPVLVLSEGKKQKDSCHHRSDDQNCSYNRDSHCVCSHGTIASQFFFGQRKPFKPPSNTLVLMSFGSAQNSW